MNDKSNGVSKCSRREKGLDFTSVLIVAVSYIIPVVLGFFIGSRFGSNSEKKMLQLEHKHRQGYFTYNTLTGKDSFVEYYNKYTCFEKHDPRLLEETKMLSIQVEEIQDELNKLINKGK